MTCRMAMRGSLHQTKFTAVSRWQGSDGKIVRPSSAQVRQHLQEAAISLTLPRKLHQASSLGHQLPAFGFDTSHTCPDLFGKVFIIYAWHGVFLHG